MTGRSRDPGASALGLALETVLEALVPLDGLRSVVEVGFGAGLLAEWLGRRIHGSGTVRAFDRDPRRVEWARRARAAPAGVDVDYRQGDVFRLPEPRPRAELVICKKLLCVVDDPSDAVDRMREIAMPGGWVVAIEPAAPQRVHVPGDTEFERLSEEMHRAFHRGWRRRGVDQWIGLRVPEIFLRTGLGELVVEGVLEVHAVADRRRSIRDVYQQLQAEASPLDPDTLALLDSGGMTGARLREHRSLAEDRVRRFAADPAKFLRSGYVRLMSPMLVTIGRRAA